MTRFSPDPVPIRPAIPNEINTLYYYITDSLLLQDSNKIVLSLASRPFRSFHSNKKSGSIPQFLSDPHGSQFPCRTAEKRSRTVPGHTQNRALKANAFAKPPVPVQRSRGISPEKPVLRRYPESRTAACRRFAERPLRRKDCRRIRLRRGIRRRSCGRFREATRISEHCRTV